MGDEGGWILEEWRDGVLVGWWVGCWFLVVGCWLLSG